VVYLSKSKKTVEKWYNNGQIITCLIILVVSLIIICSQSFANGELSFALFSSVINYNSVYLLVLVYFILLQVSFGRKNFNYLNAFLIFIYFITTVTSFLTVLQSFSLTTVLNFVLNFIFLVYLSHTLLRGTRFWREFHLHSSPFNELTNEGIFYSVCVVSFFLLIVNLISTVVVSGVILSIFDTLYYVLLGRYAYLYYEYLDYHKIDCDNEGNFDDVKGKVQEVLDKTEIDDVIVEGFKDVKDAFIGEKKENEVKPVKKKKEKKGE